MLASSHLRVLSCALGFISVLTQDSLADDPIADPERQDVFTTVIGSLDVGGRTIRIWASTRNVPDEPQKWQFRYDPPLYPIVTPDGDVEFSEPIQDRQGWTTSFQLYLDMPEIKDLAFDELKEIFHEHADRLNRDSIFARPMLELHVGAKPGFRAEFADVEFVENRWRFARPQTEITISIRSADKADIEAIMARPEVLALDLEYSMTSVLTTRNIVSVEARAIRNSTLVSELTGIGEDIVYVSRDDARELIESDLDTLGIEVILEDPESFSADLVTQIINRHFDRVRAAEVEFDEEKWKATYNANDLRPSHITHRINSLFELDDEKTHLIRNAEVDTEAELSLFGILDFGGGLQARYNVDDLRERLRKREMHSDIEGDQFVVKSVDVYQCTVASFDQDTRAYSIRTLVRPPMVVSYEDSLNVGDSADESNEALAQVRATLRQREVVPYQQDADSARTAYMNHPERNYLTEDSVKSMRDGDSNWDTALAQLRAATEQMNRREFSEAADSYVKARESFTAARDNYRNIVVVPEVFTDVEISSHTHPDGDDKDDEAYLHVDIMRANAVVASFPSGINASDGWQQSEIEAAQTHGFGTLWKDNTSITIRPSCNLAYDPSRPFSARARCLHGPGGKDVTWTSNFSIKLTTNRGRTVVATHDYFEFRTDDGVDTVNLGELK